MATGFVLITTMPGKEHDVRNCLDEIEHVSNRWMLFGEYDLIAKVESDNEYTLTRVIVEEIRPIVGIVDTKTLLGAEI
ncbi:MAG: AsnC family transcriptional regulator [Euryarchaeota archaeon]|nr:AsnC family transcriptional regulator [Euryarchaeota archaeon]|tara:strand:- start:2378 stop:2611 length:234 start_codon:yes stop_codon:yes gene_type:complete